MVFINIIAGIVRTNKKYRREMREKGVELGLISSKWQQLQKLFFYSQGKWSS